MKGQQWLGLFEQFWSLDFVRKTLLLNGKSNRMMSDILPPENKNLAYSDDFSFDVPIGTDGSASFPNLIMNAIAFMEPVHLSPSAWLEHIPFAFWLAGAHRPQVLVELGTHNGASYFAFCQAIEQLRLSTRSYAIDAWEGDEHAGFYGGDVYETVRSHNARFYSSFSTLMRMKFDDGVSFFNNEEIDLLHIDGYHTFEAVKHDFETWLPKLSKQGVVILHDSNERKGDFGVFRFVEELRKTYPCFEFIHGHGLTIVGVGPDQPPSLRRLFEADREIKLRNVQEAFARLGKVCLDEYSAASLKAKVGTLTGERDCAIKEAEQVRLRLADTERELKAKVGTLTGERDRAIKEAEQVRLRLADTEGELKTLKAELSQATRQLALSEQENHTLRSRSRRITAPLRAATRALQFAARKARRIIRSVAFHSNGHPRKLVRLAFYSPGAPVPSIQDGRAEGRAPSASSGLSNAASFFRVGASEYSAKGAPQPLFIVPEVRRDNMPAGSAFVRLLYPYRQEGLRSHWEPSLCPAGTLPEPQRAPGVALLQRRLPNITLAELQQWLREWRLAGGKMMFDIDDDLLDKQGLMDRNFKGDIDETRSKVEWLVTNADAVAVSTPHLSNVMAKYNRRVLVIPNYLDAELWHLNGDRPLPEAAFRRADDYITIGYVGTPTHDKDLAIIAPAVRRIEQEFGTRVRVEVIGAFGKMPLFGHKIALPKENEYPNFVEWLFKRIHWDIGVIPLAADKFNQSKSNLKFLECAALGMALIVSDAPAYQDVAVDGDNCLVTGNSDEEWYRALRKLIVDRDLRLSLENRARQLVAAKHTVERNQELYMELLSA